MKILFRFWGKVRKGKQRGRKLGYPTANMFLSKHIPSGIYVSQAKIGKERYNALTFIGDAKTFHETLYQSETYIIDFDREIYHTWVSITLLKKLRENQRFSSKATLIKHMKQDEKIAKDYFKQNNCYIS